MAEQLPFVSDRQRIDVGAIYVPAQDHKALAISYSRIGMITGQADIETAKNGALDNCRKALERAGINNKCELYAVGNTVVFQGGHPPMPPPPWFRSNPSIERPVNSKDFPLVSERDRSWIEKNYPAAQKSRWRLGLEVASTMGAETLVRMNPRAGPWRFAATRRVSHA
ncbi:MAG TPA: hypothetical protein VKG24_08265 [Pseudolabrys sp.]|nr:hypothetical protein [Pseudolabrys sp.]